ncbi:MAG: protein translocase SEC61 complex subunit gamma [Candidatus Methanoplasma sp.]|jgi:protein transport protein SEC61 subunit gamma-like protein|nr:protein translocase SEC61 complex subunit gamma [Candidatus Methanoplasma sp.]
MTEEESRAEEFQDDIESAFKNMGKGKYGRILKMARTPTKEEYKKSAYIAALGMVVLGAVGFAIMWIMVYLPKYF